MTEQDQGFREEPAMFVGVCGINASQVAAGLAAMRGQFTKNDVAGALIRAGVPALDERNRRNSNYFAADRAADRLLQKERKAGRVRAISNRSWTVCDDAGTASPNTPEDSPHAD